MRNFLSGGLKYNIYLEKAILTGILKLFSETPTHNFAGVSDHHRITDFG